MEQNAFPFCEVLKDAMGPFLGEHLFSRTRIDFDEMKHSSQVIKHKWQRASTFPLMKNEKKEKEEAKSYLASVLFFPKGPPLP